MSDPEEAEQLVRAPGVVEEIDGDHQVHRGAGPVVRRVGADIAASERVVFLLPLGEPDHLSGDIHSRHFPGAGDLEQPGVETFPTREVQHAQPANVSEGLEQRVPLDVAAEGELLRILVGGRDRVVHSHAHQAYSSTGGIMGTEQPWTAARDGPAASRGGRNPREGPA